MQSGAQQGGGPGGAARLGSTGHSSAFSHICTHVMSFPRAPGPASRTLSWATLGLLDLLERETSCPSPLLFCKLSSLLKSGPPFLPYPPFEAKGPLLRPRTQGRAGRGDPNVQPALGGPATCLFPSWRHLHCRWVGPAPKETAGWLQEACAARDASLNSPSQWGKAGSQHRPAVASEQGGVSDCLAQIFQPSSDLRPPALSPQPLPGTDLPRPFPSLFPPLAPSPAQGGRPWVQEPQSDHLRMSGQLPLPFLWDHLPWGL